MLTSVIVNLGMLGYFKYGGFLMENFVELAGSLGIIYHPPKWDIVLPVGISFYTFATLSYTLDVYLRRSKPAGSFLNYALFVTFFPHLVAGPIMRPTELVPQFEAPRRANANQMFFGFALLTLGMFQKVVLADGFLAPVVEAVYDKHGAVPGMLDGWAATLAFAGQIFCDFAGYSTSAIGVALCLGFAMPDNFRFPYGAVGFSDFWRRWHITLSSWLRDYLYIPLGGNRHGTARTYAALMGTMLLGGLWHGANWTFVVWGGLHGLYLSVERWLRARFKGFTPGPRDAGRPRAADLPPRQRHLGVLPRQDLRPGGDGADGHGRAGGQAAADDRRRADDRRAGHRRRDLRDSLAMRNTTLEAVIERTPAIALASSLDHAWLSRCSSNRGRAMPSSISHSDAPQGGAARQPRRRASRRAQADRRQPARARRSRSRRATSRCGRGRGWGVRLRRRRCC